MASARARLAGADGLRPLHHRGRPALGRERRPLRYAVRGPLAGELVDGNGRGHPTSTLPDEVAALLHDLSALPGPWRPALCDAILDLPGVGQCVPDLEFVHEQTGQTVYLEVLGFWSREAVWKRIELARKDYPRLWSSPSASTCASVRRPSTRDCRLPLHLRPRDERPRCAQPRAGSRYAY